LSNRTFVVVLSVFIGTVGCFIASALLPASRFWAGYTFSLHPSYILVLFGVIGAGLLVALRLRQNEPSKKLSIDNRTYWLVSSAAAVVITVLFILARTKTHFLGDGYTLLALLADADPLVKNREIGEAMAHIWLKNLIGGDAQTAALMSFRIVSITAGALATVGSLFVSRQLFDDLRDQLAFAGGMLSTGYILLYFGYVENYSLFVTAVLAFTYTGILISEGRLSKWYILVPLGAAILCHVFGVTLIPAAVYLLLARTKFGRTMARAQARTWAVIGLLLSIVGTVTLYYIGENFFFVRLAILPLIADRFTIESYTLFSWEHILDYVSLLLMILPGLLVLAAVFIKDRNVKMVGTSTVIFLSVAALSTLGAAFIFDPKLGMYRDWDLFSFALVPVATLGYLWLLRSRSSSFDPRPIAWACVLLGVAVLGNRLAVINTPEKAIAEFNQCIERDHTRNRTSRRILIDYYEALGDSAQARAEEERWVSEYPIRDLYDSAHVMSSRGECAEAVGIYRSILEDYPNYTGAWSNLCFCFYQQHELDSALYYCHIAIGMNSFDGSAFNNMGLTLASLGRKDEAREYIQQAYDLRNDPLASAYNLARIELDCGNREAYERFIQEAMAMEACPPQVTVEFLRYCLKQGKMQQAAEALNRSAQIGLPRERIREVVARFPRIEAYLGRYKGLSRIIGDTASETSQ